MFVSQERGAPRKPFQKPNILRRKTKVVRLNAQKSDESSEIISLMSGTGGDLWLTPSSANIEQPKAECSQSFQIAQASKYNVVNISDICDKNQLDASQTLEINGDRLTIYAHNTQVDNNETSAEQSTLNVESFLNDAAIKQDNTLFNTDGTSSSSSSIKMETETKPKWCLDFMCEDSKDTVTTNYYDGSQISNIYIDKSSSISTDATAVPFSVVSLLNQEANTSQEVINVPAQNLDLDCLNQTNRAVKLKCDVPNCNKGFWTEARLQKHKNIHNKQKPKTPTILDCPVKKTGADGVETKCGRTFLVRNQLMKHLNEDHSPEDALFRCGACGRRFFWAGGARAHAAGAGSGACSRAFACAWAGCGRVFRQPCRLREHARAHTGDRPYPCIFPNCGWAFRSASKLVRHARRHTGERRHACAACGRAFLRREHLRDHAARHHAPRPPRDRAAHHCTQEGCEQTFTSMSSLYMHLKKVHKKNEGKPSAAKKKNTKAKKDMYIVSLGLEPPTPEFPSVEATTKVESSEHTVEEFLSLVPAEVASESDARERDGTSESDARERDGTSARTHCTWPLSRAQVQDYTLEDDTQVEQSESSESNIYTVRSDLFLHGNVLINEDSEFIISRPTAAGGAGGAAEGVAGGAAGGGAGGALGLIDSHPTIDLMQEELLYADAVDESSFRVFLLNGEELA